MMKHFSSMLGRLMALTLAAALMLVSLPARAEGLFDNVLPAAHQSGEETAFSPAMAELVDIASESLGQPTITTENGVNVISFSIPTPMLQEIIQEYQQAGICRLEIDFENQFLRLEYKDTAPNVTDSTTGSTSGNTWAMVDLCSVCGGVGDCTKCVLGDCDHCYGEGSFYCTAGCIGGLCINCDNGKILVGFDSDGDAKYRNCSYCSYGICRKCGGDGYINCNYCSGTGRCSYCYGSGDCKYCY